MNALELRHQTALADGFRWRDSNNELHDPKEMHTRHVFHTVCMIWNHTMPEEYQTRHDYKRYVFSTYHNLEYMSLALDVLLVEACSRDDLEPDQMYTLAKIILARQDAATPPMGPAPRALPRGGTARGSLPPPR